MDLVSFESDVLGFVYVVVFLVVSWVLWLVVEYLFSRVEVVGFIGWFKSYILLYFVVVVDFFKDSVVRSSIFRLYSWFCGVEGLVGFV